MVAKFGPGCKLGHLMLLEISHQAPVWNFFTPFNITYWLKWRTLPPQYNYTKLKYQGSSGSSGRVRGEKHEIYVAAFGGQLFYRPQGKAKRLSVILFTISLMTTRSLLILVMVQSVHILLECFLVMTYFYKAGGHGPLAPWIRYCKEWIITLVAHKSRLM